MTAYVDESLRLEGAGLYVLAAVLVPDGRADAVRTALRDSVPRGLRRYHWRKESPASRLAMLSTIRNLGLHSVVVTHAVDPARQERARRQCLVRLLWELDHLGERWVMFESRRSRDRLDTEIVRSVRQAGWIARGLTCDFALPDDECLLWLPDVVAGAVRGAADGDPRYLEATADTVTVITEP